MLALTKAIQRLLITEITEHFSETAAASAGFAGEESLELAAFSVGLVVTVAWAWVYPGVGVHEG